MLTLEQFKNYTNDKESINTVKEMLLYRVYYAIKLEINYKDNYIQKGTLNWKLQSIPLNRIFV